MISRFVMAIAPCLLASAPSAQDAALLPKPTITADVLGFTVGMNLDDVLAQIERQYQGARVKAEETQHSKSTHKYVHTISVTKDNEQLLLRFTGAFSGNRLHAIQREVNFSEGERPSLSSTRQSIMDKYGAPTSQAGARISYIVDAPPITESSVGNESEYPWMKKDVPQREASMSEYRCEDMMDRVLDRNRFLPTNPRVEVADNCGAVMVIETPGRDDVLYGLKMTLADLFFVVASAQVDEASDVRDAEKPNAALPDL